MLTTRTTVAPSTPLIGFGQVRHARLRPATNRFSYGAYFLRLPLRSLARSPWRSRILGFNRAAPMAVLDRDHGDGRPLLDWIVAMLADHGITDVDGEIWLHTFPRVFGYVFNPVSFWFAHRSDGALRAVVCEVNNTFGERHCYLLAHDDAGGPLLQTSLSGTLETMSDRALLRALLGYPAFTFGVIARIHWQALKLWLKRVPFFPKPAPPAHHVSR
jgi:DUF1365 family protein